MLCKNCGRELPISGKFCPFCGATVEQTGANDETAVFTGLPDELNTPIDLSAFDAAMEDSHPGASLSGKAGVTTGDPLTVTDPRMPTAGERPPTRRSAGAPQSSAQSAPHTTYFDAGTPADEPYRRPSKAQRGVTVVLILLLILGLIGGGVWFALSRRPDENLTLAEKYMERSKFDDALIAFEAALAEAKDPAAIQLQIDQLKSFQQARSLVESGDYTAALATLNDLRGRLLDKTAPLGEAVDALIEQATAGQAENEFAADIAEAQAYFDDKKYDAAAGKLDALAADDTLSAEQKRQVEQLRTQLTEAQEAAQRQEQNAQEAAAKKQAFSAQIEQLEQNDRQIAEAETTEQAFDLTAASFEAWDQLLSNMYDHLATVLNADQYAAEEASYQQWVEERDEGAKSASRESEDEISAQLAAASFKQSYTKTRCYKLLDLM